MPARVTQSQQANKLRSEVFHDWTHKDAAEADWTIGVIAAACGGVALRPLRIPGVSIFHSRARLQVFLILTSGLLIPYARAQQAPPSQTMPTVITCTSTKGERQVCKADTTAGVALLRSTGESNCLLGNTWGYDSAGVWVSNGCGGEFALGSTKEATGGRQLCRNVRGIWSIAYPPGGIQRRPRGAGQRNPSGHQFRDQEGRSKCSPERNGE